MNMKKMLGLLALIGIIALSGCTVPVPSPAAGGGEIAVGMLVEETTVPRGSPVGVTITVENKALVPVENVYAEVYGPLDWSGFSKKGPYTIRPEESRDFYWVLTSPMVSADTRYTLYGKVQYDMTVDKTFTATIVTYDYYKRTKKISTVEESATNVGGPISISISAAGAQRYIYPEQESIRFPVKVVINNRGPGKVFLQGSQPTVDGLNKVSVTVSSTNNVLSCADVPGTVTLGKEGTYALISCDLIINRADIEASGIATYTGTITVQFSYIQDFSSPAITVTALQR
ncbi:MAG: NEW3 domain-containing protein [Candidatus Aenigmatarchaeota archaeon]